MDALAGRTLFSVPAMAAGPLLRVPAEAPVELADVLCRASGEAARGRVLRVGRDGGEVVLSHGDFRGRSERILGGLRASGVRPGDEVVFQLEAVKEFLPALRVWVLGGSTAVPVGVAGPRDGMGHAAQRLRDVWRELRSEPQPVDLFRHTTVEALAAHLGAEGAPGADLLGQSRSRAAERRAARRPV